MMQKSKLNDPILIAAWPGMGHVAVTACYYLIAKLQMEFRAEYLTSDLFDADHVVVDSGLVQPFRYPKNQFFVWRNPEEGSDLLVFIGEAQPPQGRYNFCCKLIDYVQSEGVSKIYTFASMATTIQLEDDSRVIGAATDTGMLQQLVGKDVGLLNNGSISGMNGILLGVATERKIAGCCLLGEMPHVFANVPYPKASLAVLNVFRQMTGIEIDATELKLEVEKMQQHLTDVMSQFRRLEQEGNADVQDVDETFLPDPMENGKLSDDEKKRIESLFEEATNDRSAAYELKRELDRLDAFSEYEDRFLDLFKNDDQ